jgi:Ca2+:H+ antiporter
MNRQFRKLKFRYFAIPSAAISTLLLVVLGLLPDPLLFVLAPLLTATVFVAVHHAEVVALRVGEPFGSLILAVSVTVIEVGMILALMINSPDTTQSLARDAVFAAVVIAMNGIIGISIVVRGWNEKTVFFNASGVSGAVLVLVALASLSLVLPSFTTSSPGPTFTNLQLLFAAVVSLGLYAAWLSFLTVRNRDYFLPTPDDDLAKDNVHIEPPSARAAAASFVWLVLSLVGVVGLAQATSPLIKEVVELFSLPAAVIGVSIALVVLLPESLSAVRAARLKRLQTSLNLGYGSAIASIGLTIPAIAAMSVIFGFQLNLGLQNAEIVLLLVTFLAAGLTVLPGRASTLNGVVHLAILAAFFGFVVMP